MKNSITANMLFYFKGKKLDLSASVDLDAYMQQYGSIQPLHTLLARANNIDMYSYEYEIMEQEEITFSQPEGLAKEFLFNGTFDTEGFAKKWHEEKVLNDIKAIAQRHMNVDDIDSVSGLKQALLEAYSLKK